MILEHDKNISIYEISNLKERAYKVIKDKIINCELSPGELLNEKSLVDEIGTSRTPIREALNRLEQENLIRIIPRRGVFVSDISLKDIMDIYQVRENIDPFVTRLATLAAPHEKLLYYKNQFENLDSNNFWNSIILDREFHYFIAESCNNNYLLQMIENIYAQVQRIRILSSRLPQRIIDSNREHLAIISFMLKGSENEAAKAMEDHILSSRDAAFKLNHSNTIGRLSI